MRFFYGFDSRKIIISREIIQFECLNGSIEGQIKMQIQMELRLRENLKVVKLFENFVWDTGTFYYSMNK